MTPASISGTKVLVIEPDVKSQLVERGFGQIQQSALEISIIEAVFLVETEKIEVYDGERPLDVHALIARGSEVEKEFANKYIVYKDLRDRGLLVRTGLKFGTDFRVYERGAKIGNGHSKYLVHVVPEEYTCSFPELAGKLRLAKTVNKDMIFAIVDEECDVTYYLVDRMRL